MFHQIISATFNLGLILSLGMVFQHKSFAQTPSAVPNPTTAAEYFIDFDPGQGNGIPIQVAQNTFPLRLNFEVSPATIASLPMGNHTLTARVRDTEGNWSIAFSRPFIKDDRDSEPPPMVAGFEFQWFLNGNPVPPPTTHSVAQAPAVTTIPLLDLNSLETPRDYQLLVTPIDTLGRRGFGVTSTVKVREPEFTGLRILQGGSVQLSIAGAEGIRATIQTSTDLTTWETLQAVTPTSNNFDFTLEPSSEPFRFFRFALE